jgi:hypothetical protein
MASKASLRGFVLIALSAIQSTGLGQQLTQSRLGDHRSIKQLLEFCPLTLVEQKAATIFRQ